MQNAGTVYSSTERTPTVLPEMAELLPPLSGEQLAALEADILKNGCYSPIIVNEDLAIVDGHNRQKLCEQHDIPYNIAVLSFESLLEAKQWALDTQKGRCFRHSFDDTSVTAFQLWQLYHVKQFSVSHPFTYSTYAKSFPLKHKKWV